jgi:tetratricopeptide (TPR) repeat protein
MTENSNSILTNLIDKIIFMSQSGMLDEAKSLSRKLFEAHPNDPQILMCLGIVSYFDSKPNDSINFLLKSLSINNDHYLTYSYLGRSSILIGKFDDAVFFFDKAILINSLHFDSFVGRGIALYMINELDASLLSFDKAINLDINSSEAYNGKGNVLLKSMRVEEAIECFDKAIASSPRYKDPYNNKGIALRQLGQYKKALDCFAEAIYIDPSYCEAINNRANTYSDIGLYKQAIADYDHIIKLNPDFNMANWNKSLLKLLLGEYEDGWALYEYRWQDSLKKYQREFNKPLWLGNQSIKNKTILIHAEQGYGDTIQFCRYLSQLESLGAKVLFEVPKPLISTISSMKSNFKIVEQGKTLPAFDFHCPLMSLPLAFKTTVANIPANIPYLYATDEKRNRWSDKVGGGSQIKVGLVWSGGFRPNQPELWEANNRRNIPLLLLKPLKDIEAVVFYSLQKGEPAESELELLKDNWSGPGLINFTSDLNDFSDTAALIENLDLVISVDTSTAHLAAAMGKEVWLLNRFDTCWRWFDDGRSDSPWYPTVRLFRQPSPGDWDSVIQEVKSELKKLIKPVV